MYIMSRKIGFYVTSKPSSLELNEHYIVFLQYHDGAFYTVSLEGSTIAQRDELKWKETMELMTMNSPS